jgi:hypothetical protein
MKFEVILITVTGKLMIRTAGPRDGKENTTHTHVPLPALWLQLPGTDLFLLEGCHEYVGVLEDLWALCQPL